MATYPYFIAFAVAATLCCVVTRLVRDRAKARGWVAAPVLRRHVHSRPVPRIGGVAICVSVLSVTLAGFLLPRWSGMDRFSGLRSMAGILAPAAIIFLVGLYDDLRTAGAYFKFGVQILAGVLLYLGGHGVQQFDLFARGHALQGFLALPLTVFWVALITNAFNLIDGLDGLAAGSALFSTIVVFVVSLLDSNPFVAFVSAALAGAILGFLRYNFYPASIFLGDSGSLFIGFLLSALALVGSQKAPTMVAVAIPVVSFGLPIVDLGMAVIRRFLSGQPLFRADNNHIHHKLLKLGLSHRNAVLTLYAVSAGFALLSLALVHQRAWAAAVLALVGLGIFLGVQHLRYAEFSELRRLLRLMLQRRSILANNLSIRRASESVANCDALPKLCRVLEESLRPLGFSAFCFDAPQLRRVEGFESLPFRCEGVHRLLWSWEANGNAAPCWELKLELHNGDGTRFGTIALLRPCGSEPLPLDVDLFSAEFRVALSRALHRIAGEPALASEARQPGIRPRAAKAVSGSAGD